MDTASNPRDELTPSPNRLPELDSLRGIACLMVLIPHLGAGWGWEFVRDRIAAAGVGLFFVLSGFLITRILLADKAAARGLNHFYNRRAARIFPVYFLALGVIALCWSSQGLIGAATFTLNLLPQSGARDYYLAEANKPPIGHLWSLCVEEHFYWVWPFLVFALPRRFFRWLPIAAILATPYLAALLAESFAKQGAMPSEIEGLIRRHTLTQLTAISFGALLAIHEHRIPRTTVGIVLVVFGIFGSLAFVVSGFDSLIWEPTLLHLTCAGMFSLAMDFKSIGRMTLFRGVGKISYGLYVYHLPVYAAFGLTTSDAIVPAWALVAALIATFLVSMASYRFLESPILSRVRGSSQRLVFRGLISLGTALTFLMPILAFWAMSPHRTEARLSPQAIEIDTVVLGSSHAMCGIATPLMGGKAWNLADGGQDFYYDCEIVKKIAPSMPKLRRVIFTSSYHSFHHHLSDAHYAFREALYLQGWGIPYRVKHANSRNQELEAMNARLSNGPDSYDETNAGWRRFEGTLDESLGFQAADRHNQMINPSAVMENSRRLAEILVFCQERGIDVFFVTTPTSDCYRANTRKDVVEEMHREIAKLGVRYLDYESDQRFSSKDFADPDHLNVSGAIKFTEILTADLKSLANSGDRKTK